MSIGFDRTDLEMARVALSYYRRAHILSRRPVPPAAERLADRLDLALSVTASGQETVGAQIEWLSTHQAAQRLNCCERTAQRLAERVGRRFGRDWFIPADALPDEEENDSATANQ
jgi:hypothetical protein